MIPYQLEFEPIADATLENLAALTPAELERYAGIKVAKKRREWLAGRIAAKRLIGKVLLERNALIEKTTDGVPFVRIESDRWPLSISHSGEWAVAAISNSSTPAPIGVDIEKIEARDPAWLDIAFHPSENAKALNVVELTRLWTRKEAVSKFLGVGLSIDLLDIRLSERPDSLEFYGKARAIWEAQGRPSIRLDSSFTHAGYALSVACAASSVAVKEAVHGH